jgi:hypothetical protein
VFFDNGAAFDRQYRYSMVTGFPEGSANTILVVEASTPVPWTKPDDLPYMPERALPPLGRFPGGFQAVMADGSVRFVPKKTPAEQLHKLINRLWNADISYGTIW